MPNQSLQQKAAQALRDWQIDSCRYGLRRLAVMDMGYGRKVGLLECVERRGRDREDACASEPAGSLPVGAPRVCCVC